MRTNRLRALDVEMNCLMAMPGDLVIVEGEDKCSSEDWWLGHVIHATCGARNSDLNSLFQVADVDSGFIRMINADLVKAILRPRNRNENPNLKYLF